MAIQIVIPQIPQVKIPTIPDFSNISINTAEIQASVKAAGEIAKNGRRTSLFAQLAPYKAKCICICGEKHGLSEDERISASKLVAELLANNWLDDATRHWAEENGIMVP